MPSICGPLDAYACTGLLFAPTHCLQTMTPWPTASGSSCAHLAFFLPTFYCSHCWDNQLQAGGNLMARCLSCTLLSFDFTWGFLEASVEDTCRNLSGTHTGAASARGRSGPTRAPLTDGGRRHGKHSEVHSAWLLGSFDQALLTHSGDHSGASPYIGFPYSLLTLLPPHSHSLGLLPRIH